MDHVSSESPADSLSPASILVSAGRPPHRPGAALNVPVELTSTFVADGPYSYARSGNANWTAFEETLGALEGGAALVFSSGMAAVAAALSVVPVGGLVVAPTHAYNTTGVILGEMEAAGRIALRRVDISDTTAVVEALDGADLLWAESPTNPMLEVADLSALVTAAHERGAVVMCDNTFATPLAQQPLSMGADLVMHSVTKYISGHADVILGATVSADTERGRAIHAQVEHYRLVHGAIAGPMETWLALRGMRTMHLRVERSTASAVDLAGRLEGHPLVERVRYPGLGAIVAIEVRGGPEVAERVAGAVRLWTNATSLGGVESLIERRRRHPAEPLSVPENLLRLSVGIEDVDDLWRDLVRALDAAEAGAVPVSRPTEDAAAPIAR